MKAKRCKKKKEGLQRERNWYSALAKALKITIIYCRCEFENFIMSPLSISKTPMNLMNIKKHTVNAGPRVNHYGTLFY